MKFATDTDYHPTDDWSFILAGEYATANNNWWSRVRPGYAVMKDVYVGPEFVYEGNNFYSQWRIGAHMRGYKIGPVELTLSTGFMRDDILGNGVYGGIETSIKVPREITLYRLRRDPSARGDSSLGRGSRRTSP